MNLIVSRRNCRQKRQICEARILISQFNLSSQTMSDQQGSSVPPGPPPAYDSVVMADGVNPSRKACITLCV